MEGQSVIETQTLPLVDFSVGQVKNDEEEFEFKMYKGHDGKRKLVCETSTMHYIGNNFTSNSSRGYLDQYLVVVDEETGKKRFFPVENYKLYPIVKREEEVDSDTERQQAMEKALKETRSFGERLDDLTGAFGSKMKKKEMASRQRNKVSDTGVVTRTAIQQLLETEGISGGAQAGEQNLSILPYDKEAVEESQVYPLHQFLPRNVLNAATEASNQLHNITMEQIQKWKEAKNPLGSRYITWRARNIHPSISNDEESLDDFMNCLQMLVYLMKFYAPTGSVDQKKEYLNSMNQVVKDWIREEFTPDAKVLTLARRLPPKTKDKILAYSVIIAWHIESFQFDIQMLCEGFGISETKLTTVVRALGGKTKVSTIEGMKRTLGYLELPLRFPQHGKKMKR